MANDYQVKLFIKKIIRIRKFLIFKNKSSKNNTAMVMDIDFIEKHINYNNYNETQIKSFFLRHSNRIYSLIPGTGCKTSNMLLNDFIKIYKYCKTC